MEIVPLQSNLINNIKTQIKMKTLKSILFSLLIVVSLTSCFKNTTVHPSSSITTLNKEIYDYEGIDVSSIFNVDIEFSATTESIEVEANQNLHQYIVIEKVNNVLRIRLEDRVSIEGNCTLKVHIVTKNPLDYYSVSEASSMIFQNSLVADDVTINIEGASYFTGLIESNSINLYMDGSAYASLEGKTNSIYVDASEASTVVGFNMIVDNGIFKLSDASKINLTINETIDIKAIDASVLRYKGNAVITNLDVSGSSQVIKLD